ncbi:MAG: peptide-methionine (R)-S-oxide reductase MsrB [Salibacteraceae bacterium]
MSEQRERVEKTESEWRAQLSPDEYRVLREGGTERAFTGAYYNHKDNGMYECRACNNPLFSSESKFESGSGWPSFDRAVEEGRVDYLRDTSYGMIRTEILCGRCGSHLGHVFPDGPTATGERYCVNSLSLQFQKKGS